VCHCGREHAPGGGPAHTRVYEARVLSYTYCGKLLQAGEECAGNICGRRRDAEVHGADRC
jgi:hypothetical protein